MYLALFLTALLYLYVSRNRKKDLFSYSVFMVILVLFPVTRWIVIKYFQNFYSVESLFWLFPTLTVISYAFMEIWCGLQTQKEKVLFVPVACLLICLCGKLGCTYEYVSAEVEEESQEVYQMILEEPDEKTVLMVAPKELMEHARQYDAKILPVYGRDIWEPDLDYAFYSRYEDWAYLLADYMEKPVSEYRPEMMKAIEKSGAQYVVFDKENLTFGSDMQYPGQYKSNEIILKKLGETRHYVIYHRAG